MEGAVPTPLVVANDPKDLEAATLMLPADDPEDLMEAPTPKFNPNPHRLGLLGQLQPLESNGCGG